MTFRPFIFIETNFHRNSEPIWLLALAEKWRRVPVSTELSNRPLEEQIQVLGTIIEQHHKQSEGILELWGKIQCYKYFYEEDRCIIFDPEGQVIKNSEESCYPSSAATLSVKGRDLTKLLY